jgi:hypothetical protein
VCTVGRIVGDAVKAAEEGLREFFGNIKGLNEKKGMAGHPEIAEHAGETNEPVIFLSGCFVIAPLPLVERQ